MTLEETLTALKTIQREVENHRTRCPLKNVYAQEYKTQLDRLREFNAKDDLRAALKWYKNHLLR